MPRKGTGPATSFSRRVARVIDQVRSRSGMSHSELAQRVDLSENYLFSRLRGDAPYNTNDLDRIAHAFGMEPTELLLLILGTGADGSRVLQLRGDTLGTRLRLLQSSVSAFDENELVKSLQNVDPEFTVTKWQWLQNSADSIAVSEQILNAIADYFEVTHVYLVDPGDAAITEQVEAELEFKRTLQQRGANGISARSMGSIPPALLREISETLRSLED